MPKAFFIYLLILFALVGIAPLLPPQVLTGYMTAAIVLCGLIAIVFQKKAHHQRFVDMGFRLNRNALIGVGIGLIFTALVYAIALGLPCLLGWAKLETIPQASPKNPFVEIVITLVGGSLFMLPGCLFGEELAFRGYVLPKLAARLGPVRGIAWCAVIFAVWHLPAYFSVYRAETATLEWRAMAEMILGHGISVIPVCILYLTTRELYGVSLYHTLADVMQYAVIRNPSFGDMSKNSLYDLKTLDPFGMEIIGWLSLFLPIAVMWTLCRLVRKWTLPSSA
ncbi:MAG: type II CAAX endopeptidase family protein [Verrucomicrobiae bacterium]|nr:type II CAAX endopeptidase family protein [Verrucomicrobiae bacterium]